MLVRLPILSIGLLVAAGVLRAATFSESFATDPAARGWKTVGDPALFQWNSINQNLEVTWDSSRSNSFFHLPLGTIVSKSDDFSFAFDLRLADIAIGTSSNKPYTFEIALGLLNFQNATNTNYFRGTGQSQGYGVRNAVEFDYFPATVNVSPTFAPTVISSNVVVKFSDNHPLELTPHDLFRIALSYTASNQLLKTSVTRNGLPYGLAPSNTIKDLSLTNNPDFRVDQLAIINYSDALQAGSIQFWGSVLAHGTVDNLLLTVPDVPVAGFTGSKSNSTWRAKFTGQTNWFYALERSPDLVTWSGVSPTNRGMVGSLELVDTNAPAGRAFYRVRALKP